MIAPKNYLPKLVTGLAVGLACGTTAFAQSSDTLIDKLVEKGILTVKEANQLREESDKDFTKAYSMKSGMPDWVNSLKLNGDFRGRFEQFNTDMGTPTDPRTRDRYRYRLRFGATALLSDNFEVGMRLSSGEGQASANTPFGGDPLSPNTTLNNNASRKFVFIDLAYAKWTPTDWAQVQIGKMQNQFWTSPMVFDGDYNPEGAQERLTWNINDKNAINFTSGQWVIGENATAPDTFVFVNQVDWTAKWNSKFSTRAGVMMYNFAKQSAATNNAGDLFWDSKQNGTPLTGPTSQEFNPIIARADATYNLASFPLYKGEFPITLSAEYANNLGADGNYASGPRQGQHIAGYDGKANEAYNLGVTFGSAKAKGNWQISYNYRVIETAALWRDFCDSDFGFAQTGGTDVRGHVISASYKVLNPLTLGATVFLTEQINNSPRALNEQTRIQVDALWSF